MGIHELVRSVWGRRAPRPVRSEAPLAPGERPLSVARTPDGQQVVASDQALYYPAQRDGDGADGQVRLAWDHVVHVAWYRDEGALQLMVEGASAPIVVLLDQPARVPETVRERVMSTILISEHFRLRAGKGARIAARRPPGSADIRWMVAYDVGVDPADPQVRAAVDQALARLREQVV